MVTRIFFDIPVSEQQIKKLARKLTSHLGVDAKPDNLSIEINAHLDMAQVIDLTTLLEDVGSGYVEDIQINSAK